MDSMRSLNTSLPTSTPRPQPSEQLLQSFKAAALSVTNLYKNAVCEQAQARAAGYQEAIEDLLHFLDRENLGLGDGEGWKVRQWATEKCDGTPSQTVDEDDRAESEKLDRSGTQAPTRKEASANEPTPLQQANSVPPPMPRPEIAVPPPQQETTSSPTLFTFTAGPSFPQCQELEMDMQSSDNSTALSQDGTPVSVSLMPRTPRQAHRHNHNHSYHNARPAPRDTPTSIGSKRKFTFPDFFDLSSLPSGRDNTLGGGKRSRFT